MEELGKKALFHQQRGEGNGGEMMEDVAEGCRRQGCWTYLFNNFKLLRVLECEACENVAGCKLPNAIDRSKFTKLRKLEIFGSLHIEDCKEGLDKNLSIITSKYLQSLSIDGGGIDPKLLVRLLSSCVYLCELILDGKMRNCYQSITVSLQDSLTLKELVNLEEWKVEEAAMPALHHLKIEYCETLKLEY
ncbi:hypothetical protein Gorai_022396 [Gossypium raimondii]|uniref:Uncharacterized protein n=1 Tax=Gossypium raimondii TaxID=29730 RepID=A0A7J8NT49_GOSRA|nr:hypothetical protein [Gossypium raimondii]